MTRRDGTFTRRHVIGGAAAAAGAGLLAGPASVLARETAGGAVFSCGLAAVDGVSPVVAAGRRFVVAGVRWTGPAAVRIEVRARAAGGRWSPWAVASVRGHGPDLPAGGRPAGGGGRSALRGAASSRHVGEPVWFGPADEVQLRTSAALRAVRIQFVAASAVAGQLRGAVAERSPAAAGASAGGLPASAGSPAATSAAAAGLPLAQPILPAGAGQPPIIARSAWAGRSHGPAAGPYYGAVRLAFVHHSDGPNGYAAGEVPAMILAIYLFHRLTRGWLDIGYNFVIDAFGRIWEARAGGIDEPVIGAHAGGYNAVSTGICMLGTFSSRLPTPAAMNALERLLAWKLSLHGVPILGTVRVEVDPVDAYNTPFRPGQLVRLPRVAGHRDGDSTDCPGTDLYAQLPAVRARVDGLAGVPAKLTLAAAETGVGPGTVVPLAGRLRRLGGPGIGGDVVEIQTVGAGVAGGGGGEMTFATVTTAGDGSWSATLAPERTVLVRALHRAAPAVISDLVQIGVAPVVALSLVSALPLRVAGTIAPAKRSVTLDVYRLSGPHRRLVLSRRVAVHRGRFGARLSLGRRSRGRYVVVARAAADAATVAGASAPVAVTV